VKAGLAVIRCHQDLRHRKASLRGPL
jgi:hypothetical protein